MLRHWSAGSGPAGRLFCKSNRSTRRALSGGPLSFSLILLPLPYISLSLSFVPSPSSPFSSLSPATSLLLRRGRHFIFKKRPASVHFRPFSTQPRLPAPLSLSFSLSLRRFPLRSSSSPFLSFSDVWSRCRAAYGGAMANSDPDSHEAGKKKKLDNTDGKSAFGYLEQLGTGKVEVILPSFFSFLPFVYLISRQIKGTGRRD